MTTTGLAAALRACGADLHPSKPALDSSSRTACSYASAECSAAAAATPSARSTGARVTSRGS